MAVAAACGDNVSSPEVAIVVGEPAWVAPVGELVKLTPGPLVQRAPGADNDAAFTIQVVDDQAIPVEGFSIEQLSDGVWRVHANDVLGAQYGAAAALENLGIRFNHPSDPEVPAKLAFAPTTPLDTVQQPAVRVRGLHFHTLHPVESHFALWKSAPGSVNDAHRLIDWVVKNRGNYVQWAALNDIADPSFPDTYTTWKAHTQELLAYAHARGVRVGLNIQLFGQSNLQQAFDLSEDQTGTVPIADEIAARLPLVTDGLPFDVYDLSFGEFLSSDPAKFIAATNEVQKQLAARAPNAEMHAIVHDGAEQRVTYMGEDLIYYFLVKFASPAIIPDIHTVMYFDLFEDAGGAYKHDDFHEHLAYLESRMCAKQKAAYHPEDAYWVAFDNSVPQFFPLYMRSRWTDLHELSERPCWPLDEHLVFSSGFEWGYWMNDVASLRASYTLPATADELIRTVAPAQTADAIAELVEVQHTALIDQRLAAYLASRDAAIDVGRDANIVSQPDKVTFADLVKDPTKAAWLDPFVLQPLATYAERVEGIPRPPGTDRWTKEVQDGLTIDAARARFVIATYTAVVDHLSGDAAGASAAYADAGAILADATKTVAARHAALHDRAPQSSGATPANKQRLLGRSKTGENATFYQYGYLFNADTLCFWHRELGQVGAILGDPDAEPVGDCLL